MRRSDIHAFTLIELVAVLATISLLTALLMPALGRARSEAREIVCRSNLHQLILTNSAYATENGGFYVAGNFIRSGDSGSLMVTQNGNNPVGLNFAGGGGASFANPIGPVLQHFGVTVASN